MRGPVALFEQSSLFVMSIRVTPGLRRLAEVLTIERNRRWLGAADSNPRSL